MSGLPIDFTQRWIAADNWTYTASLTPFTHDVSTDASHKTLLVFYGLDTIANIVRDLCVHACVF